MLALKPNCECCDIDLPPESNVALVCSFECTFCTSCAKNNFQDTCPNCGGEFVKRPIRPAEHLTKKPASTARFLNQKHAKYLNFGFNTHKA